MILTRPVHNVNDPHFLNAVPSCHGSLQNHKTSLYSGRGGGGGGWGGVHLPNGTLMAMVKTTVSDAVSALAVRRRRCRRRPQETLLRDTAPPSLHPPQLAEMSPYDVLV